MVAHADLRDTGPEPFSSAPGPGAWEVGPPPAMPPPSGHGSAAQIKGGSGISEGTPPQTLGSAESWPEGGHKGGGLKQAGPRDASEGKGTQGLP